MLPSVMTCLMVWAAFSTAYLQQSVDGSSTRPPAMKAKMWRRHLHQQVQQLTKPSFMHLFRVHPVEFQYAGCSGSFKCHQQIVQESRHLKLALMPFSGAAGRDPYVSLSC